MPTERGYRDNGRLRTAVSRVGYCLSNARRPCRNCSTERGCADEDGYNAGESKEGTTRRWTTFTGDEASCCCMLCNIVGNAEEEMAGRGIDM
jgi:hypothetical protein